MATCKECLHYEACVLNEVYWVKHNADQACSVFKDKSKYVEQKHGQWERSMFADDFRRCSECCAVWNKQFEYCPHCGAKMDGEYDDL